MVVTEALAHGIPVLATVTGGLVEALGAAPGTDRPGLLVPADDAVALAQAISAWLTDHELRQRLRHAARVRRQTLPRWSTTVQRIACVLGRLR